LPKSSTSTGDNALRSLSRSWRGPGNVFLWLALWIILDGISLAGAIPIDRSSLASTAPSLVAYHWRRAHDLLALAASRAVAERRLQRAQKPSIPTGPLVEQAFDHWLEAFQAAPQFGPLVEDLSRSEFLPSLISYCRKNREGPRRRACLLALCAVQPEPLRRFTPLREFEEEFPTFALFHVWYAGTLVELHSQGHSGEDGCYQRAVDQLVKAWELDPFEESAYERLTRVLRTGGSLLTRFQDKIPLVLRHAACGFHLLAEAETSSSKDERERLQSKGREEFEMVTKLDAATGLGDYLLGVEAFRRSAMALAVDHLEQARMKTATNPNVLFLLARGFMEIGCLKTALSLFSDLSKNLVEPGCLHNMAVCLIRLGRVAEARACYLRTLALHPFYEPTLINLATLEIQLRNDEMARSYLEMLLSWYPRNSQGLFWRGGLALKEGDLSLSQYCLESADKLAPRSPWVQINLGVVQMRREEYHLALETLSSALSLPRTPIEQVRERLLGMAWLRFRKAQESERGGHSAEAEFEFRAVRELLGPSAHPRPPFRREDTAPLLELLTPRLK